MNQHSRNRRKSQHFEIKTSLEQNVKYQVNGEDKHVEKEIKPRFEEKQEKNNERNHQLTVKEGERI